MKTTVYTIIGTITAGWALVAALLGSLLPFIGFMVLAGVAITLAAGEGEGR